MWEWEEGERREIGGEGGERNEGVGRGREGGERNEGVGRGRKRAERGRNRGETRGRDRREDRERGRWNALIRVSKRLECSGGGVSMFVSESDLKGSEYWQNIHNKRKTYRATWEEQRLFL